MRRIALRRPSPALIIALIALFTSLTGTAWALARNSIHSWHIVNDAVTGADIQGGGGRTGTIKNRDTNASLAIAKGFASIQGGPAPSVLNFGGQQTATSPPGVSVAPVTGQPGAYDVTFKANLGTGKFARVDSVNDLSVLGTADSSTGGTPRVSWDRIASSASQDAIRLRVRVSSATANFSIFVFTRTVT